MITKLLLAIRNHIIHFYNTSIITKHHSIQLQPRGRWKFMTVSSPVLLKRVEFIYIKIIEIHYLLCYDGKMKKKKKQEELNLVTILDILVASSTALMQLFGMIYFIILHWKIRRRDINWNGYHLIENNYFYKET